MNTIEAIQLSLSYIEKNLCNEVNLGKITEQLPIPYQHVRRLFSLFTGMTLEEYIKNRKLTLAAEELMNSNYKIADIAVKYGFSTPESFSRAFSQFHHKTPSAVRKHGTSHSFSRLSTQSILEGIIRMEEKIKERGYLVGQIGPVYLTNNMKQTVKWFEKVLGWYANIESTDAGNNPLYGSAMPFNGDMVPLSGSTFNGLFLLPGEPVPSIIGMAGVKDIDKLYAFVRKNGWNKITEVTTQSLGVKSCSLTTIDGCILIFFEVS